MCEVLSADSTLYIALYASLRSEQVVIIYEGMRTSTHLSVGAKVGSLLGNSVGADVGVADGVLVGVCWAGTLKAELEHQRQSKNVGGEGGGET
jgi:hypothetical protein